VFFGKWKQIIIVGEEFNAVAFFGFKRSRFLAIPVLATNTELQYDSNTFLTAGINVTLWPNLLNRHVLFMSVTMPVFLQKETRKEI